MWVVSYQVLDPKHAERLETLNILPKYFLFVQLADFPPPFVSDLFLESKMIEKHGGYKFTVPVVPSNFNFGGSAPGMN